MQATLAIRFGEGGFDGVRGNSQGRKRRRAVQLLSRSRDNELAANLRKGSAWKVGLGPNGPTANPMGSRQPLVCLLNQCRDGRAGRFEQQGCMNLLQAIDDDTKD